MYLLVPLVLQFVSGHLDSPTQKQLFGYLLLGCTFFAAGLFISLMKSGLADDFNSQWQSLWSDFKNRFVPPEKPKLGHNV